MTHPAEDLPQGVVVRPVSPAQCSAVRRLLDATLLEVPDDLEGRLVAGDGFLALGQADESAVLGVLLLDGCHIDAIAVQRPHRDRGIGSVLVQTAAVHCDVLTAEFRSDVRPFYESLGFRIVEHGGRLRGILSTDDADSRTRN